MFPRPPIRRALPALLTAAALAAASLSAAAQGNLDKLKQFKVATTDLNIPVVPQTGRNADAIRANLRNIKMPPGFKIE
ncbi:MAG: sorbosone dehydrogenase, partial [Betaproteobacteria bacterium]